MSRKTLASGGRFYDPILRRWQEKPEASPWPAITESEVTAAEKELL